MTGDAIEGVDHLEIEFEIKDRIPFRIELQPVYCGQSSFIANKNSDDNTTLYQYNLHSNETQTIPHEHISYGTCLGKGIAVDAMNQNLYIFDHKGTIAKYNMPTKTMSYLFSPRAQPLGLHHNFNGCYIDGYNLLFFVDSLHSNIYTITHPKLQSFVNEFKFDQQYTWYPKGLIYCAALERIICINDRGILYAEMKDIVSHQKVIWNRYAYKYQDDSNQDSRWRTTGIFGWFLYKQCYLIFIDNQWRMHCLDLRDKGYGFVPRQKLRELERYWMADTGFRHGFAVCDDDKDEVHLFSEHKKWTETHRYSKHVTFKLRKSKQIIDGFIRNMEKELDPKIVPVEMIGLISLFYPDFIL